MSADLARSVLARLVNHAKATDTDANLVLARYGIERLLYRLSRSRHAERFVLKGAMLLLVWLGESIRPTRDADLLGFGELSADALNRAFTEICGIPVEPDDGVTFDAETIRVDAIRREDPYGGQRIKLLGRLGERTKLRVQVDVGIGDAVTPEPEWLDYPSLLDLPRPRIRAYRPETAIAEKLHAMITLGSKNSRMRDFFDIRALARSCSFEGAVLARAVAATFGLRSTEIPAVLPIALTPEFAELPGKSAQWSGFVRFSRVEALPLAAVIHDLAAFLGPVLAAVAQNRPFDAHWPPAGPWRTVSTGPERADV